VNSKMDVNATLDQAIAAVREGRKAEARQLLESVLDTDERNEKAWLWLGSVVDSDEERIICLENVLTINPSNEMARKGLAVLRAEAATTQPSTPGRAQEQIEPPPAAEGSQPPVPPPASRAEAPAGEAPSGPPAKTDSRAFIVITIVLAVMLICTVLCILAFVALSPLG
jgi:hypothetical protein